MFNNRVRFHAEKVVPALFAKCRKGIKKKKSTFWVGVSQSLTIPLKFHSFSFKLNFLVHAILGYISARICKEKKEGGWVSWPNKHQQRNHAPPPVVGSVTPNPIYCVSSRCSRRPSSLKSASECMCCGATSWRSRFHQAGWWAQETAAVIWRNVVSATEPLQARGVISLWFVNHTPTLGWNIFDQCLGSWLFVWILIPARVKLEGMEK